MKNTLSSKISILALSSVLALSLASCKTKPKDDKNTLITSGDDQVIIEDKTTEQPFQPVENEQQANALNEGTVETIKEVEVQDRIFFDYNSSDISDAAKTVLNTQVDWLKSSPNVKITIEGHCDERGTREYNIALGERRALSAKNYLVAGGIDNSRIQIISYGKERPAYFGSSEDIYAKNRRAVVVPNQ